MGLVTRSDMRSYLLVNGVYREIGEGFTDFTENKNPKEYSRQYIHESAERTDLVGFAPSVTYAFDVFDADEVQAALMEIMLSEAVGDAAAVTVVTAFLHKPAEDGCVEAVCREYTVCPAKLGAGTEALICSGTLKARGDAKRGTFDVASKQFHEK
ncbi:MAG: hypothetical protein E7604_01650 [Ruminococcaceae bacterium]|nr:hypothetical protein [Oscillospiraceae bacterium]